MNSQAVIQVEKLSKAYTIWASPAARLHGPVMGYIGRWPFLPAPVRRRCGELSRKSFKRFFAVRDVSLEVRRGESVGIIGLNGSGKSTLLQMVAGTLQPTEGSVRTVGRVASLLELGSGFNPEFTGRENAFLNATILGLQPKEIEARFDKILDFAEIGDFIDQPVKTYSSGMALRLAFGVLTQVSPDILIIDEALAVGDVYFQHKCIAQIREFQRQGTTLLFVSHSPGAIKSLCTRAILLDSGMAVRDDAPDTILDYYNAVIAKREGDYGIRLVEASTGKKTTRSGNGKAFVSSVDLFSEGKSVRAVNVNSKVVFRVCVTVKQPLKQLTVGIMLRDRLGNDVFGTNTCHAGVPLVPRLGGVLVVDFEVAALALGVGHYSLTTGLHSDADHMQDNYDWWDQALIFCVVPGVQPRFAGTCYLPVEIAVHHEEA